MLLLGDFDATLVELRQCVTWFGAVALTSLPARLSIASLGDFPHLTHLAPWNGDSSSAGASTESIFVSSHRVSYSNRHVPMFFKAKERVGCRPSRATAAAAVSATPPTRRARGAWPARSTSSTCSSARRPCCPVRRRPRTRRPSSPSTRTASASSRPVRFSPLQPSFTEFFF